jgi:hypothetical protein
MTSKLNRSLIQVSGKIEISIGGFTNPDLIVNLNPLKQSKSGVYEIKNKLNNKKYIGMARNLVARKAHHWSDLLLGRHKSKEMQKDLMVCLDELMCKHENDVFTIDDVFEFNVILYCYPSNLNFWELLLIDNLKPEYNTKKKKLPVENNPIPDIDGNWEVIKDIGESNVNISLDDCEQEIM